MKKKVLVLLAVILLITAACSRSGSGNVQKAAGSAVINFLADPSLPLDKVSALLPEFEKANNAKVNIVDLQETNLRSKTVLELSSPSTDIQVYMLDFTLMPTYIKAGYLEPLDAYLASAATYSAADYAKPFLDAMRGGDNKIYALPMYHACAILVYRADLFSKYNLNVPGNYAELEEVCRIIKKNEPNMSSIVMRGQRGYGVNEFVFPSFLSGFGGSYFKADGVTPNLDAPEAIAALEYYGNILKSYGPAGIANYSHAEVQNDMLQGNAAMFIDSANLAIRCEYPAESKVAGKLGYAVVPGNIRKQPGFYTWALGIASNSNNKDVAAKFVTWMMSPAIAVQIDISAPVQTFDKVYSAPKYPDYTQARPMIEVMNESFALSDPDYRPRIEEASEVGTRVSIAIQEVLAREKSARDALLQANADIAEIMKSSRN
jgi:ABC-type glycerol-3-phosphate transport system substrate-binding protein